MDQLAPLLGGKAVIMLTRSQCIAPDVPLETQIEVVFRALKVSPDERAAVLAFLEPLRVKDPITHDHYEHSLRVGLVGERIGRFMHLDSKALFYAGMLHDTGKCQTPLETLGKKEGWSEQDAAVVSEHVMDSYRMIKGRFNFTAEIVLLHHRFQAAGYPARLPPFLREYNEGAKMMIKLCGYLLALADVYDALHRADNRNVPGRELDEAEIKAKMLEYFADQRVLVQDLYEAGIFIG